MGEKICLITGANAGIGKAAAIQLAQAGHHVLMGCRNKDRGIAALDEVQAVSGSQRVELVLLDMASQQSIQTAVANLTTDRLDVLIHNAAEFDLSRKEPAYSPENIETVWATNHLGPVLLTALAIDRLKASRQGRVITIASKGLILYPFLRINFNDPEFGKGAFTVEKAYYHSKLAQVMFTYWLAENLKDTKITANCIRVTNVRIDIRRYPHLSQTMKWMYGIKSRFSITPEAMAKTYTYLATDETLSPVSGQYFDENNRIVSSSAYSRNPQNIQALMERTMGYLPAHLRNGGLFKGSI